MVHPVDVGRQRVHHGSLRGIPDSHRLIVTCAVDETLSSPADTADAALVSRQYMLSFSCVDDPYPDC